MSDYRLYIIGRDGHFSRAYNLDCADDAAAKVEALNRAGGLGVELWSGARCVATISPTPEGQPLRKLPGILARIPFKLGGKQTDA